MPTNPSDWKFITKQEANVWLKNQDFGVCDDGRPARPVGQHWKIFEVPKESRLQSILASHLVKLLDERKAMLLLTDWPIYTESEMQIFVETREQYAEHRPLIEAPGCLFETLREETEMSLTQIVNLMFAFNFEGFLLAEDKSVTIWLADEIVELAWSTEAITAQLEKSLAELQIVPLQQSNLASGPVT